MGIPKAPLCSVCIANYNGMSTLADCIDSVLNQTINQPIEIILHDDASIDESVSFIIKNYPDVIVIESPDNVGFCVSNNRMVDIANGEYILLLNNDAMLFPDALEVLYKRAKEQSRQGILGLPQYDAENGELIDRGSLFDPFMNPVPNLEITRKNVGMIIGACFWIPKSVWHEFQGFPEWFHTLAEDMLLSCMSRLHRLPVEVLPESGFKHWVGNSLGGGKVKKEKLDTTINRRRMSERNKTFVMYICNPGISVYMLPIHLCLLLLEGAALSVLQWDYQLFRNIYFNCISEVWKNRKILWNERKRVQNLRKCGLSQYYEPFVLYPYKLRMLYKYGLPTVRK